MHICDDFLQHSGIVRYRFVECKECLFIESLIRDHGIDPRYTLIGLLCFLFISVFCCFTFFDTFTRIVL